MFKISRRTSILFASAAILGTGVSADPAHAAIPAPTTTIATNQEAGILIGLLLPAVQAAREQGNRAR